MSALQASHQVVFVVITWSAWAVLGAFGSGLFALSSRLLRRDRTTRPTWSGWPAVVSFLAIDVGIGELGLERGAPLAALGLSVIVVFAACKRLGRWVPGLESSGAWAVAGVLLVALCSWRIAGSPPAEHGVDLVVLPLLAGPLVVCLPRALGRLRTSVAPTLVVGSSCAALQVASIAALALARREHVGVGEPNVLLVTIDTLRTDAAGCYGGADASTPTLDRLAEEGTLFENAHSPVPMTYPAHTSILSGLYPGNHGVLNNMPWALAAGIETLPELFARRGYLTAGIVSGYTVKRDAARLHQRFQVYDDTFGPMRVVPDAFMDSGLVALAHRTGDLFGLELRRLRYGGDRPAERCVESALEWLARAGGPYFLWVHLFDPHLPYEPPREVVSNAGLDHGGRDGFWYRVPPSEKLEVVGRDDDVERLRALYRAEVSYADAELGVLLDALRSSGREASTLVVVTSDHGESLGEHDYWFDHSYFLYETCLRVPLIVRVPAVLRGSATSPPGTRVRTNVRLVDIAPTVIELLSLDDPDRPLDGVSLVPLLQGAESVPGAEISLGVTYDLRPDRSRYSLSVRDGDWKYIRTAARWDDLWLIPEGEQLFDLRSDPGETRELSRSAGSADTLSRLRALADDHWQEWAPRRSSAVPEVTAEGEAQLEAIGY